jgi:type I restriction-modification system DNA methylase subunit
VLTRESGQTEIEELTQRFRQRYKEFKSTDYKEAQLRTDFINVLLRALGWDVRNEENKPQRIRDVIVENLLLDEGETSSGRRRPDYSLRFKGENKFFLEAKKPAVAIETAKGPALQIRRYGWSGKLPISVLTNFDKLVIYDCRYRPKDADQANVARYKIYNYTEYVEKFDEIYDLLSKEAVYSGDFDQKVPRMDEISGTELFDDYFLNQIERWRHELAINIFSCNNKLNQDQLNYTVQRLLNRIIFLRICEDRKLEKYEKIKAVETYEELKAIFLAADKRYNSGLFDFIEDEVSLSIRLRSAPIVKIFKELYYPESPYSFSVVNSAILSQIYERFLAKQIVLSDSNGVHIEEKPEVVASQGVVSTPKFVVDSIIESTLAPYCRGKSPADLRDLRLADIACGSGTFLLAAFEYLLNHHLEWYIKNDATEFLSEGSVGYGDSFSLPVEEKNRILLSNVFGVDVDEQAVEVTQFSLLLKILEGVSSAEIGYYLSKNKAGALPKLDKNVVCGNSLVDDTYFRCYPGDSTKTKVFESVKPFDWYNTFPEVFSSNGGFDLIIGNPPYTRIQNMVKYSPKEAQFFRSRYSPYKSGKKGNIDKYYFFIERGLSLLNSQGILCYIVPNKFFKIKAGQELRRLISLRNHLKGIINFGTEQVFAGRTNYTCILKLSKSSNDGFTVEFVTSLSDWLHDRNVRSQEFSSNHLSSKPWIFIDPELTRLFDKLSHENPKRLADYADIFVGVQTSKDEIFVIRPDYEDVNHVEFIDASGRKQSIERSILRPAIYDVKKIPPFSKIEPNAYIIFPYEIIKNRARAYSAKEMKTFFPKCWQYLNSHKHELLDRNISTTKKGSPEKSWYVFGRSQSLTKFDSLKLIWPTLSLEPRYAYDDKNIVFTGGGNGPYYGLKLKKSSNISLLYLQSILCHPIIDAIVQSRGSAFRGGYVSHGKQFVETLPIREIDHNNPNDTRVYDSITKLGTKLCEINHELERTKTPPQKSILQSQKRVVKDQLDRLVTELYGFSPHDSQLVAI